MPDDSPYFNSPPTDDDNGLPMVTTGYSEDDLPSLTPDAPSPRPDDSNAMMGLPPLTDDTPQVDLSSTPLPQTPPPPASLSDFETKPTQAMAPTHPLPTSLPQPPSSFSEAPKPPLAKPSVAATPPKPKSSSGIGLTILGLLTLLFAAASAFLYTQNMALKKQLDTLTSIQQQRELPVITPTPVASEAAQATPAAALTPGTVLPLSAFADLANIIALAQTESATAQLLMITSDNIIGTSPIYKYWFRRGPGLKTYFFIQKTNGENPKLFSSATVNPDNEIPDLLPYYKNNQLGLDSPAAYDLIYTSVVKPRTTITPSSVSAKYLRALPSNPDTTSPVNLWQLTFKFPTSSGVADIVVQLDATTKQVLFTNLPTSATPTPTPNL